MRLFDNYADRYSHLDTKFHRIVSFDMRLFNRTNAISSLRYHPDPQRIAYGIYSLHPSKNFKSQQKNKHQHMQTRAHYDIHHQPLTLTLTIWHNMELEVCDAQRQVWAYSPPIFYVILCPVNRIRFKILGNISNWSTGFPYAYYFGFSSISHPSSSRWKINNQALEAGTPPSSIFSHTHES